MRDPSSPTRGPTCIPCIGRQILNLWATREVLEILSFPNKNCNLNAYISCINILNKKNIQCSKTMSFSEENNKTYTNYQFQGQCRGHPGTRYRFQVQLNPSLHTVYSIPHLTRCSTGWGSNSDFTTLGIWLPWWLRL